MSFYRFAQESDIHNVVDDSVKKMRRALGEEVSVKLGHQLKATYFSSDYLPDAHLNDLPLDSSIQIFVEN